MSKPHNPSGRIVGYSYCIKCGLVYLKNELTYKAIKASCPDDRNLAKKGSK